MTESSLVLSPSADLTGSWQKTAPLPIDSNGFVTPTLKAWDSTGYVQGDAAADALQTAALTLPDLGEVVTADITVVGVRSADHNNYTTAYRTITLPTGIQAGDLILVSHAFWTDYTGSAPGVASDGDTYTRRFSNKNSGTYDPRIGLDWKVADGDESGATVTVVLAAAHPATLSAVVLRGVDPSSPFDASDTGPTYASGANPNPPAITTVSDGAAVLTFTAVQDGPTPAAASPSSGFTELFDAAQTYGTRRGCYIQMAIDETAGSLDPGAITASSVQLSATYTVALSPATQAPDRTLIVVASSADQTAVGDGITGYDAAAFDDFATLGTYDGGAFGGGWTAYDSAGNAGNGLRDTSAVSIVDSTTQTLLVGDPPSSNGQAAQITASWDGSDITSGIVQWTAEPILYGRVRFRAKATGDSTNQMSPVILMWPDDDDSPAGGEIDMWEGYDARDDLNPMKSFLHRENPLSAGVDEQYPTPLVWALPDIPYDALGTDWHTYEMVWSPTSITISVDDFAYQSFTEEDWIPDVAMKFSIQLDAWGNAALASDVHMWVDWVSVEQATFGGSPSLDCTLDGRNEIQTLTSVLGAGTFTLTLDGQTTASIAYNADAATIQAALEALSNVSVGDVRCDGGALNSTPVNVEFDNNWGAQDVPLMSSSSGSVTVSESVAGYDAEAFTSQGDINVPRAGASMEPQTFIWSLTPTDGYVAGRTVSFEVSDHGTLKSWAAVLQVWADLDTSDPIDTFGTEANGTGAVVDIGAITPATAGSKVLVAIAKAKASGFYSTAAGSSTPARTSPSGTGLGDAMALSTFTTPPVNAAALNLATASWSGSERYAAGTAALVPATPPTSSLTLASVIDTESVDDWIEIAGSAGSLEEYIEVDATSIPSDAYLLGFTIEFAHAADAAHKVTLLPVGIDGSGNPTVMAPVSGGLAPTPLGSTVTVETERFSEFPDGSLPSDYDRFGIAIRSSSTQVDLGTHRIFWARLKAIYLEGGPVVSGVLGPTIAGDPITWDYSSAAGFPMSHYRVLIQKGFTQDPVTGAAAGLANNPWAPSDGDVIYDSGMVPSSTARSLSVSDAPIHNGNSTVSVMAWANVNGTLIASDWASDNYSITGAVPSGLSVNTAPYLDATTGVIRMSIDTGAAQSRAWVVRSDDGGTVWRLADTNPFVISASSTDQALYDDSAPLNASGLWRVVVDDGEMTESSAELTMNASALDATPDSWFLQVPGSPSENLRLEVANVSLDRGRRSVVAARPSGSVVASGRQTGWTLSMTIRLRSAESRALFISLMDQTVPLRIADIYGRSWMVRPVDGTEWTILRWRPTNAETTPIRDAHSVDVTFVEVTRS